MQYTVNGPDNKSGNKDVASLNGAWDATLGLRKKIQKYEPNVLD